MKKISAVLLISMGVLLWTNSVYISDKVIVHEGPVEALAITRFNLKNRKNNSKKKKERKK